VSVVFGSYEHFFMTMMGLGFMRGLRYFGEELLGTATDCGTG
jgi:hypothetical protein